MWRTSNNVRVTLALKFQQALDCCHSLAPLELQVGTAVQAIVTVERISGSRVVFHTVCRTTGSKICEVVDGQALALFPA